MNSKRFKKLPTKTSDLQSEAIEKILPTIKKIVQRNLMSQLI